MTLYDETLETLQARKGPYCGRIAIDDLDRCVRRRNYREFVERFKAILSCARLENLHIYEAGDQDFFTRLFELWFRVLAKPGFEFVRGDEVLFYLNAGLTNLLAATPHGN
ncbi:MAG: hypothetical protein LBS30_01105, partial [Planctomycetota bacterium]|nr:hypothetical protein [Planctomycetota bacterium]